MGKPPPPPRWLVACGIAFALAAAQASGPASAARGKYLFEAADCNGCHAGGGAGAAPSGGPRARHPVWQVPGAQHHARPAIRHRPVERGRVQARAARRRRRAGRIPVPRLPVHVVHAHHRRRRRRPLRLPHDAAAHGRAQQAARGETAVRLASAAAVLARAVLRRGSGGARSDPRRRMEPGRLSRERHRTLRRIPHPAQRLRRDEAGPRPFRQRRRTRRPERAQHHAGRRDGHRRMVDRADPGAAQDGHDPRFGPGGLGHEGGRSWNLEADRRRPPCDRHLPQKRARPPCRDGAEAGAGQAISRRGAAPAASPPRAPGAIVGRTRVRGGPIPGSDFGKPFPHGPLPCRNRCCRPERHAVHKPMSG
ncbi:MAG: c-type cytochrome [Burkholderiaceae bacterium]